MLIDPNAPCQDRACPEADATDIEATVYVVQLSAGHTVTVEGADAYQPEGPMTTFFATGSSRRTIDSWSDRLASFRTADVVSVRRCRQSDLAEEAEPDRDGRPTLVAV